MLILTRRVGETLLIGDDVTVTVMSVKGNQVRIGVSAPRDTDVDREEIRGAKLLDQLEQRQAAEAELIKGLYVIQVRTLATDEVLLWIATEHDADHALDKDPAVLPLLRSACPGIQMDDITLTTIWAPDMVHYHATFLERPKEGAIYAALLADCKAYAQGSPFVVPRPTSKQVTELEGAA